MSLRRPLRLEAFGIWVLSKHRPREASALKTMVSELYDRHSGSAAGQHMAPVPRKLKSGRRQAGRCPTEAMTLRSALEFEA